jgi:hypothetical protein
MADAEIVALRAKLASRPRSDDYRQRRRDIHEPVRKPKNKPCGFGGYSGSGSTNRLSGGSACDGPSRGSKPNRVTQ